MPSHYLSLLVLLPLAGALLALSVPHRAIRAVAVTVAVSGCAAVAPLWLLYNPKDPEFQLVERLGAGVMQYALGVDGISIVLVLATTLLGFAAAVAASPVLEHRVRAWHVTLFIAQAGATSVLLSLNLLVFTLGWAVAVTALVQLAVLGRADRLVGERLLLASAVLSIAALLAGALTVAAAGQSVAGVRSFDFRILGALSVPVAGQWWSFGAFLLAFGLTVPLFLFPGRGSADVAGGWAVPGSVLLTLGFYGFVRVSLPLLPEASRAAASTVSVLVLAGVVGAGVCALLAAQARGVAVWLSAMVAMLGVAGVFVLNPDALSGAVVQQTVRTLCTGALLLLCTGAVRRATLPHATMPRQVGRWSAVLAVVLLLVSLVGGLGPGLLLAGPAARGSAAVVVLSVGVGFGLLAVGRFVWLVLFRQAPVGLPAGTNWSGVPLASVPAIAAAFAIVMHPAAVVERLTVPALKVAARIDTGYTGAFEAACDTTVTDAMKAANPANQFLTAAPCGPNGEPLPAGSGALPSASAVTPPR